MLDTPSRNFLLWIVQAGLTVDGIVSGVPSWGLGEVPSSYLMKFAHKPALFRLQYLISRLVEGERVTAGRVATQLEVSVRTVMRDIDYLMNVLHVPIQYDHDLRSYVLRGSLPLLFSLSSIDEQAATADEIHDVVMVVDADLAEQLARQVLHPTQQIERDATDRITIRVRLAISNAMVQWVLGQAGRAQVLEPAELRTRVVTAARQILARQDAEP